MYSHFDVKVQTIKLCLYHLSRLKQFFQKHDWYMTKINTSFGENTCHKTPKYPSSDHIRDSCKRHICNPCKLTVRRKREIKKFPGRFHASQPDIYSITTNKRDPASNKQESHVQHQIPCFDLYKHRMVYN